MLRSIMCNSLYFYMKFMCDLALEPLAKKVLDQALMDVKHSYA